MEPNTLPPTQPIQPTEAKEVVVLHNPKAGSRDVGGKMELLVKLLGEKGFPATLFTDLDLAVRQAKTLFEAGKLRALVGAGGDGTIAELVNRCGEGVPMAIFPAGNENLLARHLKIEPNVESLAGSIMSGRFVRLDVGRASGRIFLLMASCGLDAEVVRQVHANRKGHIRSWNYFKPLWDALRTYKYPELRVYCDEALDSETKVPSLSAKWLCTFNLPCYGGGLRFVPDAVGDDSQLDLCGFKSGAFWRFLKYMATVYLGQHRKMKDWIERRARRIRIESDVPVPYQLDGDPGGWLPLDIEILPKWLPVIVPNDPNIKYT